MSLEENKETEEKLANTSTNKIDKEAEKSKEEQLRLEGQACGLNDTFSWKDLD